MTARNSTTPDDPGKPKLVDRLGCPIVQPMYKMPEYAVWRQMNQRCTNPRSQRYDRYGARGIRVCEAWARSFEAFLADMGRRPSDGHSLDRIDNDGNYEPGNCRWATKAEQNRNRSDNVILEHDGRRMTVAEWAREIGVNHRTLAGRIESGMPTSEAITRPVAKRVWTESAGPKRLSAETVEAIRQMRASGSTLNQVAAEFGVSFSLVSQIARGKYGGRKP
jgi:hypothetical protein